MSRYQGFSRERFRSVDTTGATSPARTSAPHIVVSPRTASGLLTGSAAIVLAEPSVGAASEGPAGFSLTLYRSAPTLGTWGKLTTFSGVHFNEQLVLNDISGGFGLYYLIEDAASDGLVLVGLAEQA